jgi:long-chain acyl-CoA synthetase
MLYDLFKEQVRSAPGKLAIVHGSSSATYRELDERVTESASVMQERIAATGRGSERPVVAICLDNSIYTLEVILAASLAGLRLCILDPAQTGPELDSVLDDCRPMLVIAETKYKNKLSGAAERAGSGFTLVTERPGPSARLPRPADANARAGDDFLILYTSGSTGKPKGVVQSHGGLAVRLQFWIEEAGLNGGDSHLCVLPLSHAYGLVGVALPSLSSGGSLHLSSLESCTPQDLLGYIEGHKITCFYGLPLLYRLMARVPRALQFDLHSLRMAMVASAAVDEETIAAFKERFGILLNNSYGTSETGIITYNHHSEPDAPVLSIGRPIRGIEYMLSGQYPADDRELGELCIRTAAMATGYFSADLGPIAKAGWFNTGDLVHEDERGYLHIAGRTSSLINVGGNKFMPEEVESVIAELEGVKDVAIVAAPDRLTGEKVVAFVVKQGAITEADIRAHCREKLAGFKCPALIEWLDELPRSSVNKLRRSELTKYLAAAV